jgi:hypothetical protein
MERDVWVCLGRTPGTPRHPMHGANESAPTGEQSNSWHNVLRQKRAAHTKPPQITCRWRLRPCWRPRHRRPRPWARPCAPARRRSGPGHVGPAARRSRPCSVGTLGSTPPWMVAAVSESYVTSTRPPGRARRAPGRLPTRRWGELARRAAELCGGRRAGEECRRRRAGRHSGRAGHWGSRRAGDDGGAGRRAGHCRIGWWRAGHLHSCGRRRRWRRALLGLPLVLVLGLLVQLGLDVLEDVRLGISSCVCITATTGPSGKSLGRWGMPGKPLERLGYAWNAGMYTTGIKFPYMCICGEPMGKLPGVWNTFHHYVHKWGTYGTRFHHYVHKWGTYGTPFQALCAYVGNVWNAFPGTMCICGERMERLPCGTYGIAEWVSTCSQQPGAGEFQPACSDMFNS